MPPPTPSTASARSASGGRPTVVACKCVCMLCKCVCMLCKCVCMRSKTDLMGNGWTLPAELSDSILVSSETGEGIEELVGRLRLNVENRYVESAAPVLTRTRHLLALQDCLSGLSGYQQAGEVELAAEDLRLAVRALGKITGRVDVEDVLDIIFKEFCIGK